MGVQWQPSPHFMDWGIFLFCVILFRFSRSAGPHAASKQVQSLWKSSPGTCLLISLRTKKPESSSETPNIGMPYPLGVDSQLRTDTKENSFQLILSPERHLRSVLCLAHHASHPSMVLLRVFGVNQESMFKLPKLKIQTYNQYKFILTGDKLINREQQKEGRKNHPETNTSSLLLYIFSDYINK